MPKGKNETIEEYNKRRADYMREYRKDNPEYRRKASERQRTPERRTEWIRKHSQKRKDRRSKMKKFVFEIKKNLKCERCSYNKHPAALQFHHRDPNQKEMSIKDLTNRMSKERILEEIKKCEVLCANCHQILHFEEKPYSKFYLEN